MNNNSLHNKNNVLHQDEFFDHFAKFIRDSTNGKRLQKNGKSIRQNTIMNYHYTYKLLVEFCRNCEFNLTVPLIHRKNDKFILKAKNHWVNFYRKFTDYLYKQNYFDNYVGLVIKTVRIFMNYLRLELQLPIGQFHLRFYIPKEDIPVVVLSPEMLKQLINNKTLEKQLSPELCKVKDVFVFGCAVALRVSDLLNLKQHHLKQHNNKYYIEVNSIKTGSSSFIHLPPFAVAILNKYQSKSNYLLPRYSVSNFNNKLKLLGTYILNDKPLIKVRSQKGKQVVIYKNKEKKEHYTFADQLSSHTMRRTAITTMLSLGMPEQLVRRISGHAPNSKEFFKYVNYSQKLQDSETEKMFEKLLEIN